MKYYISCISNFVGLATKAGFLLDSFLAEPLNHVVNKISDWVIFASLKIFVFYVVIWMCIKDKMKQWCSIMQDSNCKCMVSPLSLVWFSLWMVVLKVNLQEHVGKNYVKISKLKFENMIEERTWCVLILPSKWIEHYHFDLLFSQLP